MRHKTKDKGDLAVAKTLAHLLEHDIRCCLPLSEHLPFDLIAVMPDMRTLRRVQVKYRKVARLGSIELSLRSNYYNSKRIYWKRVNLDEIDAYAVYCSDNNEMYYICVSEIPPGTISISLRTRPTKNNQSKGVWLAEKLKDPHRIAPCDNVTQPARRIVNNTHELAIANVIADLTARGIWPCVAHSQYVQFDLVAVMPDMKTMYRLRVGYGRIRRETETDYYAIYDPDGKHVHYIKADTVPDGVDVISANTGLNVVTQLNGAFAG